MAWPQKIQRNRKIMKLRKAGYPIRDIAKIVECSHARVWQVLRYYKEKETVNKLS